MQLKGGDGGGAWTGVRDPLGHFPTSTLVCDDSNGSLAFSRSLKLFKQNTVHALWLAPKFYY